ncbi:MAG: hypothetical protein KGL33_05015 [Betaproteobacteria bacterium]|nr:hypothetical protein [Betaproteobacteria bacterium]
MPASDALISSIRAQEILDSRGTPTVKATITLQSGARASAAVPSGVSTGSNEAVELRDGDPKRYFGKGVRKVIAHIEGEIAEALKGRDVCDQAAIDAALIALDGTPNKARLGANALLAVSMERAGYRPGEDLAIALDPASTSFYKNGRYHLSRSGNQVLDSQEMVELYQGWLNVFPIVSIEDGHAEDDWAGFAAMTRQLGGQIQIVGDDNFVTNAAIFRQGIANGIANAILIKLNQIGTVTETIEAIEMARRAGYAAVVSHRSGETEDTFIADFVVAMGTGQIKTGAPSRSERVAKYNRLLRIEEELGDAARYLGRGALAGAKPAAQVAEPV